MAAAERTAVIPNTLHQGWLQRKSKYLKAFKKRWVSISSTAVSIAREEGGPPRSMLSFQEIASVDASKDSANFLITIRTKGSSNSHDEVLRADSKEDFDRWVTVLEASMGVSSRISGESVALHNSQSSTASPSVVVSADSSFLVYFVPREVVLDYAKRNEPLPPHQTLRDTGSLLEVDLSVREMFEGRYLNRFAAGRSEFAHWGPRAGSYFCRARVLRVGRERCTRSPRGPLAKVCDLFAPSP